MSNQNVWDDVDVFGVDVTIKKNVGNGYISSWENFLIVVSWLALLAGIILIITTLQEEGDKFNRIIFLVGYLFIWGFTYGKMVLMGETKKFRQYIRIYFFASFAFALGLIFYDESGWWSWLGFAFFCLSILCFYIARKHWTDHKELINASSWEHIGNGQKFLIIIQNDFDVMLYELKDKIYKWEYDEIAQIRKSRI